MRFRQASRSVIPQTGPLDSLPGFGPVSGDIIQRYNNAAGAYDSYTFTAGAWSPSVPVSRVGESFWIDSGTARTWNRTFGTW